MKAIVTRYHGPTNSRGSRIRASEPDGRSVTVPYDHALNSDANHLAAAVALCERMQWGGRLIAGGLAGNALVFVFSHGEPTAIVRNVPGHGKFLGGFWGEGI